MMVTISFSEVFKVYKKRTLISPVRQTLTGDLPCWYQSFFYSVDILFSLLTITELCYFTQIKKAFADLRDLSCSAWPLTVHASCPPGGAIQQNGHTTAEIQEEVALTSMGSMATAEKHHSHVNTDKLHFPRANLQTITTLGWSERPLSN